ncbi:hypothetical protein CS063_13690 [Sporanaerobium hydrogeniformans]|uniref:Uncharacterized protein n=1 Tax=Sporanaerobium hydrogeniformans TaxID=3072179 RepID=A0AC61DB06_9FIRM|nr:antA/AntB antirepressor family protein [Sporanaerobium hydrogeniformans]PHV69767.1 hypothetical protein CS063_13690 [Sporanaerobium hydrogeniformans]
MYELLNIEVKDGKQLISGRELHEKLKVQQDFSDWMKKQLELVDAEENIDYTRFPFKRAGNNATLIEYSLTVDIAKEICMVVGASPRTNEETRILSKKIRKYFIGCEKLAKQLTTYYDEKFAIISDRLDRTEKLIGLRSKSVFNYGRYIKNKMGINRATKDYDNVKMVLFAELGVNMWEQIDYSLDVIAKREY